MALTAQIETDVGVPSQYQRITRVAWDATGGVWTLTVELYASEDARRAGRRPLVTQDIQVQDARLQPSPLRAFYQAATGALGTVLTGAPGDEQVDATLFVADGLDPGLAPVLPGEVLPVGEAIEVPPPPDSGADAV
jgi:hypothetical protein